VDDSQQEGGPTGVPATCEQLELGLRYLHEAMAALAGGATRSFSLVEIDGNGVIRKSVMSLDGERLDKLAAVLQEQSVLVSHCAGRFQGNAPAASRSNRTQ
jgi:hypothetical protein